MCLLRLAIVFSRLLLALVALWPKEPAAQAQALPANSGSVYYDAEEVSLINSGQTILLKGDVLFLFGTSFVKSETLTYDRQSGIAVAEGRVRVLKEKERMNATRLIVHSRTQEVYAENVRLLVDPKSSEDDIEKEVLGISRAEVAFETEKANRQKKLILQLQSLRDEFVSKMNLIDVYRNDTRRSQLETEVESLERRYAQILGRLARTRYQPNLFLESLDEDARDQALARRESVIQFAKANKKVAAKWASFENSEGYLAFTADSIYQKQDGTIESESMRVTPCRCGVEDRAIWGFSASTADIEPGQYATLYGSTFDVAEIPVAYLPYLKIPIKDKRESGFLLPSVYLSRAGQVTSLPYFQTLGDHADTTLTVDDFSARGTRFGVEVRGKLTESANARVSGEFTEDDKRVKAFDRASLENEIDRQFSDNEIAAAEYKQNIGDVQSERWLTTGSVNVPYRNLVALKGNWTFMSDNQYLSDYSVEQSSKSDLFAPAQSTYRFLSQEVAAEYYGSRFGLSIRIQRLQDVLEVEATETPFRSPKVEFALFPLRILESRFHFDQESSWELVDRQSDTNFVDLYQQVSVPAEASGRVSTSSTSPQIRTQPDGLKTPNEPYVAGQRLFMQSRLSAPVFSNKHINSNASVRGISTAYIFDATPPFDQITTRMAYVSYDLNNTSEIDFTRSFRGVNGAENLDFRTTVKPFANLSYVPQIYRDELFPGFYDVFYSDDNAAPIQKITFGFRSRFSVSQSTLEKRPKKLRRIRNQTPPQPGNTNLLANILASDSGSSDGQRPQVQGEQIFQASKDPKFSKTLLTWAQRELKSYRQLVLKEEFDERFQWLPYEEFRLVQRWKASPFGLGISTSYNFDAESTKENVESRLRRGQLAEEIDPWGDIVLTGDVSGSPWVPVSANTSLSWSPLKKRIHLGSTSISLSFPFHLKLTYSNSFETFDVGSLENREDFVKRTIGLRADYQPLKWLRFTFQRRTLTNSQDTELPEPELRYESLQKLSFVNIQDCLDIEIKRLKERAVVERNAEWSIGLNLRFLNQSRDFGDVGGALNRTIQNRDVSF